MSDRFLARMVVLVFAIATFAGIAQQRSIRGAEEPQTSEARTTTTVGMFGRLEEVVLPGSELEVIPLEDRSALIVLRIVRTFPHGTDRRYDFEYYGLEPGTYDLTEYLRRKDLSETGSLPPLRVEIATMLPPGQIEPHAIVPSATPRVGGYTYLLIAGALLWVAGLVVFFFLPRRKRGEGSTAERRSRSLAERLRPLIDRAASGEARHDELAALERNLLAYWRRRLKLDGISSAEAITKLRVHPEAGALMRSLEAWLHQERTPQNLDVDSLLAPYRDVSEREFDDAPARRSSPASPSPAEA